jgi:hypothetical protein
MARAWCVSRVPPAMPIPGVSVALGDAAAKAAKAAGAEEIYRAFVAELERLDVPHGLPRAESIFPLTPPA